MMHRFPLHISGNRQSANHQGTDRESREMVRTVYRCGKRHNWHKGVSTTAWCLSYDGLMETSAHVFKNATGATMAVVNLEGTATGDRAPRL
jgi:hypothetical protein